MGAEPYLERAHNDRPPHAIIFIIVSSQRKGKGKVVLD